MRLSLWKGSHRLAQQAANIQNYKLETWKCHYISLSGSAPHPHPALELLENRVLAHRAVRKVMRSAANSSLGFWNNIRI